MLTNLPPASGALTDSPERVVLVDPAGTPIGTADKAVVHTTQTPLHLAFSCYLFDGHGRVLMTRRAGSKATWPGVWTNTCCGHPAPGETARAAVERRLRHELGIAATELRLALPRFAYRATDAAGIVENELCPVWVGRVDHVTVDPDPAEVMDLAWVEWDDLTTAAQATPFLLSPWCVLQVRELAALDQREELPA